MHIRKYDSLHVVQFRTYQVVADDLELHVNWLMAGCFGNCKFAIGILATPLLFYCHTPTNGQHRVDIDPTPARSVSSVIELAILIQHIMTEIIFFN